MNDAPQSSMHVMPAWSAYAGEPFNLSERRPLMILEETAAAFVVDGFYHRAQFWKAVVPKRGVAQIVGQRLNFSKPRRQDDGTTRPSLFFLNHVQARVIMRPEHAVPLYEPQAEPAGEPACHVTDFAYSVEAVGPHGRKWNLSDALLGNLAIVHRFLSTEEVAFERIMRERMTVVQSPPLPLDEELLCQMLCEAVRASHDAGLARPYFMMRPPGTATNCTSEPLKLLDGVLRTPLWQRFFHRFPVHPRGYLKLRGLWTDGPAAPTLNDQMAEWMESEAAKERRHLHVEKKKSLPHAVDAPKVGLWRHLSRFGKAMRADGK
ncbi:MAG: hypothetical protein AB7O59_08775 [Pirellulales bacterium]